MWNFESYNTDFIKDNSDFLYFYSDFQFKINLLKEEKKLLVKIFYKQKYVDSFVYEYIRDSFLIKKEYFVKDEMFRIVETFYKQNFLFIQKRIIQLEDNNYSHVSLWFCCYNNKLEKTLSNEMKYKIITPGISSSKTNLFYIEEVINKEIHEPWPQYLILENWIEKVLDNWKRSFQWVDLLSQIKQLKQINEKALYTICQEKNFSWNNLYWTIIILIKKLLELTQTFFWDDYEVDLREIDKNKCGELTTNLASNYTLYLKVRKKSHSTLFEEHKFKDFQKEALKKFPQVLKTYFLKKDDNEEFSLEKKYCSFNIRVQEDWTLSNLREVEDVLYHEHNYYGSLIEPTFLTSYVSSINSLQRTFLTNIISSKKLYKIEELKIYYDIFSNKDNFIRKRAKYFLDNKNEEIIEKNIFLYQVDILNKKYGKWNYIFSYKHNEYVKFLKENWEIIYSISKEDWIFKKDVAYKKNSFLSFDPWSWFVYLEMSDNNYLIIDLIHLSYSTIRFSREETLKVYLQKIWLKGLFCDWKSKDYSLFRLTKDCMKENFEYNLKKLPLWINLRDKYYFFLFQKWVRWISNIIKKQKIWKQNNYWNNLNMNYMSYYNFVSNNTLDVNKYISYFYFKNPKFSENLVIEDKTIIKENDKLWILSSWIYWYSNDVEN